MKIRVVNSVGKVSEWEITSYHRSGPWLVLEWEPVLLEAGEEMIVTIPKKEVLAMFHGPASVVIVDED